MTRITSTLDQDVSKFMICHKVLLIMRNDSDKNCRENKNTFFCSKTFFSQSLAVYGIIIKKCDRVRQATDDNIIRCLRFARWVSYCIMVGSRRLMSPDALQSKAYCTNPGL